MCENLQNWIVKCILYSINFWWWKNLMNLMNCYWFVKTLLKFLENGILIYKHRMWGKRPLYVHTCDFVHRSTYHYHYCWWMLNSLILHDNIKYIKANRQMMTSQHCITSHDYYSFCAKIFGNAESFLICTYGFG